MIHMTLGFSGSEVRDADRMKHDDMLGQVQLQKLGSVAWWWQRLPPHTFLIPLPRDQTRVRNRLEHGAMMDNHQATASSPWI
jgi:hypothetical protein